MSIAKPIQKSAKVQIRVELSDYQDRNHVNIREYVLVEGSYIPTKKGITCPPEKIDELIDALKLLKPKTAKQTLHVEETTDGYLIARNVEDVVFNKKHFYQTLQEARSKTPPAGYFIFKIQMREGSVVRHSRLAEFKDGRWIKASK